MRYDANSASAIEAAPAIEAKGLIKEFGKTKALDGVDLVVPQGRVLGLLGPNGAGKTTAVRILATLLKPDGGHARVCGYDVQRDAHQVRQVVGLTGQYASVDEGLSGTNNLVMIGRLLGIPRAQAKARAAELLDRFDLADAAGRPAKTYSGGMRRRLDLAASLVGSPRVLYLDEPTTGLDPRSRTDVWRMVRELVADGVTVLLTTQYLDEADQMANDIVVIDHGKVIATGTPDELKAKTGGQVLELAPADLARIDDASAVLAELTRAAPSANETGDRLTVQVADATLLPGIVRELDHRGIELAEFTLRKASLDEVFFSLTGNRSES
jgi:oleandomycin transport system ATP-binding protein